MSDEYIEDIASELIIDNSYGDSRLEALVKAAYILILNRLPDPTGLLNYLSSRSEFLNIIIDLIKSSEYQDGGDFPQIWNGEIITNIAPYSDLSTPLSDEHKIKILELLVPAQILRSEINYQHANSRFNNLESKINALIDVNKINKRATEVMKESLDSISLEQNVIFNRSADRIKKDQMALSYRLASLERLLVMHRQKNI